MRKEHHEIHICIDPVTYLTKLVCINNKSAAHIGMRFENEWLAHYPVLSVAYITMVANSLVVNFQRILMLNGIKDVAIMAKNPQANPLCCIHYNGGQLTGSEFSTHFNVEWHQRCCHHG